MSFGCVETLYQNLKSIKDKERICNHFGVRNYKVFENYIYVIRTLRNTCAHGGVLYDLRLPFGIMTGPAGNFRNNDRHNLLGALEIVEFFLGQISKNRLQEMKEQIAAALSALYDKNPNLINTIKKSSGDLKYKK